MKQFTTKLVLVFITLTLLLSSKAMAQNVPFEQEQLFRKATKQLLEKYALFGTFSENGIKISEDYLNEFQGIFKNAKSSLVYNDINLNPKKGDVLSVVEYVNQIRANYLTGFDIIIDTENFTILNIKEISKKPGYYLLDIQLKKELYGLSRQNILHSYKGDLIFQFEAVIEGGAVSSIAITSINDFIRYRNLLANDRLGGFHLSLAGEPAQSTIIAPTIVNHGLWKQMPQIGVNYGLNLTWFFNRSVGLSIGVNKTDYNTDFILRSFSGQSTTQMIDDDDDVYYPVYEISDLKEANTLSYLEIPITLNYRTGNAKAGIYLDLGMVYALSLSASYKVEGLTNRMGYYPEYDLLLDDVPEYGFETVVLDDTGDWQVKASNLSAIARLGVSFPITQKIYFKVGGVVVYGISDILYNKPKHNEDFISTTGITPSSTSLMRMGVEVGISFKLF